MLISARLIDLGACFIRNGDGASVHVSGMGNGASSDHVVGSKLTFSTPTFNGVGAPVRAATLSDSTPADYPVGPASSGIPVLPPITRDSLSTLTPASEWLPCPAKLRTPAPRVVLQAETFRALEEAEAVGGFKPPELQH